METSRNLIYSYNNFPKDFMVGDEVIITELPTLHTISPSNASGTFRVLEEGSNGEWLEILYPLETELFNFEPIPFTWKMPPKDKLYHKFKILDDPFYQMWLPEKNHPQYREGIGYIIESKKTKIKDKDVEDILEKQHIIKTFSFDKYYAPISDEKPIINITYDHFKGEIVRFIVHGKYQQPIKNSKSSADLFEFYRDSHTIALQSNPNKKLEYEAGQIELLDSIRVKIINKFGIYLEIPIKIIKKC